MNSTPPSTPAPTPAPARDRGLSRVAIRNAISTAITRTSSMLVGILLTPIVLGHLGRDLYGVVVIATSAYEYLSLLRGGLSAALRRFVTLYHHAGKEDEARRVFAVGFWWTGVLRSLIILAGVALAKPICAFLRLPADTLQDSSTGIALIIAAAVVADAGALFEIPIYATGRTASISWLRAAASWVRLGITVLAFALFTPDLTLYGLILLVAEGLPILYLMRLSARTGVVDSIIPPLTFGTPELRRKLFSYGGLAIVGHIAGLLYTSADSLLIGRLYGADDVTRYSLGTRWAPLIQGFAGGSVASLTPLFTQLEARGEARRGRNALVEVVGWTCALAVTVCLVPCVIGDLFLVRWVGAEYRGSHAYMMAMLIPLTLEIAFAPAWMALVARGRVGWLATGDIIVAVGNVLFSLFLALVLDLGLLGFALGNTAALLAKNLLLRPLAGRREPSLPPLTMYLRAMGKALVGGLPGLALLYLARPLCATSFPVMVAAAAVAAAITLTGAVTLAVGIPGIRVMASRMRRR